MMCSVVVVDVLFALFGFVSVSFLRDLSSLGAINKCFILSVRSLCYVEFLLIQILFLVHWIIFLGLFFPTPAFCITGSE